RNAIGNQPACTDSWFGEVLSRSRSGNEEALREISGRCLTYVLDTVERRFPNRHEEELLDIIQDANAALLRAIESFAGTSAAQFLAHLDRELGEELDALAVDG